MLVELLQKQSGLPLSVIMHIADTASKRYKTYPIPKRSGGTREISHPSRGVKAIQRWISKVLLRRLAVHEAATAYSKGSSIKRNAERHLKSHYTLRLDFENFFPSFESAGISEFLNNQNLLRELELSEQDIKFVSKIVTRYDRLTIGAPSSPILTNAMMYEFDDDLSTICLERNLIYTRYADDIFISAFRPDSLNEILPFVGDLIQKQKFVDLKISEKKTAQLSRKYRRSITGLVVTPDQRISIGRARKRMVKSLVFRFANGDLSVPEIVQLCGLIAFVRDVDRHFLDSLVLKYGSDILERLQRPYLATEKSSEVD
ncbi:MAG: retron St85 family RNA-directed DNA polymerase [Parvibaculum sp.]|uniref:retron St85 family RNA-directed DNA polymerase n=1 Tax=Parvibaculum sp. TaxID=2024848 RepID=UPI0032675DFF